MQRAIKNRYTWVYMYLLPNLMNLMLAQAMAYSGVNI